MYFEIPIVEVILVRSELTLYNGWRQTKLYSIDSLFRIKEFGKIVRSIFSTLKNDM